MNSEMKMRKILRMWVFKELNSFKETNDVSFASRMNIINDMLTITNASREQIQVYMYIIRFTEIANDIF